jgi:hypothetical protein
MSEEIEDFKKLYEQEKKKVAFLEQKVTAFESPGKSKMYYALNRNQNDLADMLNGINLKNIAIDDPKDKTMERLKMIWTSMGFLATTLTALGQSSGVLGKDEGDDKTPFIESIAETRK